MAYCTVQNVRDLSGLTTSDINDETLSALIGYATKQLNRDINTEVVREKVEYIDLTRENNIDGSNTTFYVKNWKEFSIADSNDDGTVDSSDITVYSVDGDGTETELTVSSVSANEGKFVLSSAPEDVNLYVTYQYSWLSESDPHPMISMACAYLAASLATINISGPLPQSFSIGKVRVSKQTTGYERFYKRYQELKTLMQKHLIKKSVGEVLI